MSPPTADRTVIVIAKEPVPGRVKTRLCPPCTHEQAAALAAAALADTFEVVAASSAHRRVVVLDGEVGPWLPSGFEVIPQRAGPFGERLDGAWRDTIGDRACPTVQIGMDTPQLSAAYLDDAFALLDVEPAVLGPAEDGGWWGLGLRAYLPGAFDGVPMSHVDTGRRQSERLTELLGTVPVSLPLLRDVDHIDDALAAADAAPDTRFARLVAEIIP